MSTVLSPSNAQERGDVIGRRLESILGPCDLLRTIEGPRIIQQQWKPQEGTRVRHFANLSKDLSFAAGDPVTVLPLLPGLPGAFGTETERENPPIVRLDDLAPPKMPLGVPIGIGMDGKTVELDFAEATHSGVMGRTGGGKSVCVNVIAGSLATRSPDRVAFLMADMKQVELMCWSELPHMLAPIATTPSAALDLVGGAIDFMESRYDVAAKFGARSLAELNVKLEAAGYKRYPDVFIFFDEFADLMLSDRKRCESGVVRLAQKARAVGIHLILATQSPRVTVFTGLLKANIPTRIAFAVPSMTDSRVILDQNGAQDLLGRGDGLLSLCGAPPVRFQCAYIDSDEIDSICRMWR